jgi:hypothetical protein
MLVVKAWSGTETQSRQWSKARRHRGSRRSLINHKFIKTTPLVAAAMSARTLTGDYKPYQITVSTPAELVEKLQTGGFWPEKCRLILLDKL